MIALLNSTAPESPSRFFPRLHTLTRSGGTFKVKQTIRTVPQFCDPSILRQHSRKRFDARGTQILVVARETRVEEIPVKFMEALGEQERNFPVLTLFDRSNSFKVLFFARGASTAANASSPMYLN